MNKDLENKEQQEKPCRNGKDWIGNIVKNWKPLKTKEEHWKDLREKILKDYLKLFDSTKSDVVKNILYSASLVYPDYRFQIPLFDFKDLNESDFNDLRKYTDHIKVKICSPGDLLLAIFYKEKVENYKIKFNISEQSVNDMYSDYGTQSFYTVYF